MNHLAIIVPFDLDESIYPWGPRLICEALAQNIGDASAQIIDLRTYDFFLEAYLKFKTDALPDLHNIATAMRQAATSWWDKVTFQESALFATAFLLGDELLDALRKRGIHASAPLRINPVLREIKTRIETGFRIHFSTLSGNNQKLVWGFSSFDCFFSCLALSKLLKSLFVDSFVIWGGSRLEKSLVEAMLSSAFIDGVVLGPGEKPIVEIFRRLSEGENIRTMKVDRFFNHSLSQIVIQESKKIGEKEGSFSFEFDGVEWDENTGVIHILEDVRCKWSKCSFCREAEFFNRYENDFFATKADILLKGFAKALERAVQSEKHYDHIWVRISSDDPDLETIERLIRLWAYEIPEAIKRKLPPLEIWSYCRVNQLCNPKFHRLAFLRDVKGLALHLCIPIESMNPHTLKLMIKGTTVLKNLKAMKLARDAGIHNAGCYYFANYPGEKINSIKPELDYLLCALHLLPSLSPTIMWASPGTPMGLNQKKYGIKIHASTPHPLAMLLFGIPLPWGSYSAYDICVDGSGIEKSLQLSYFDVLKKISAIIVEVRRTGKIAWFQTVRLIRPVGLWLFWQMAANDFNYLRRLRLILFFLFRFRKNLKTDNEICFKLTGDTLIKVIPKGFPTGKIRWQVKLNADELAVLRYLYHYRQRGEIFKEFLGQISADRIEEILNKHIRLQSVIQYGGRYLSLFNDPEFLVMGVIRSTIDEVNILENGKINTDRE